MRRDVVQRAKQLCRDLRKRSTKCERLIWERVRNRKFLGCKFYRQYPIFFQYADRDVFYIADFYCHEVRLVIEIDGLGHDIQKEYDEFRTQVIRAREIEVYRVTNQQIKRDINGTMRQLAEFISRRAHLLARPLGKSSGISY